MRSAAASIKWKICSETATGNNCYHSSMICAVTLQWLDQEIVMSQSDDVIWSHVQCQNNNSFNDTVPDMLSCSWWHIDCRSLFLTDIRWTYWETIEKCFGRSTHHHCKDVKLYPSQAVWHVASSGRRSGAIIQVAGTIISKASQILRLTIGQQRPPSPTACFSTSSYSYPSPSSTTGMCLEWWATFWIC